MKRIPGVEELFRLWGHTMQTIAANAVTAGLATISRGGKVLWTALPYPLKAVGAVEGHVGAVQPDGLTTDTDPETGILIAAIPLDGESTGTIAYFVAGTGPDTGWVLLPIT